MNRWTLVLGLAACLVTATAANAGLTTFANGDEGWSVSGRNDISIEGGNPNENMDVSLIDVFGADIRNETNTAFQGDFTQMGATRFTVDIKIDSITYFGMEVERDLVVELRDYTPTSTGYPYASVWALLGTLTSDVSGWQTYSIDLLDPTATELPDGWGGYGDEDPVTYEPILPADRTFASVLSHVDEIHFTTFVPGWFFGFTNFEMAVDNVGFVSIPEPTSLCLLGIGSLMILRRRR